MTPGVNLISKLSKGTPFLNDINNSSNVDPLLIEIVESAAKLTPT